MAGAVINNQELNTKWPVVALPSCRSHLSTAWSNRSSADQRGNRQQGPSPPATTDQPSTSCPDASSWLASLASTETSRHLSSRISDSLRTCAESISQHHGTLHWRRYSDAPVVHRDRMDREPTPAADKLFRRFARPGSTTSTSPESPGASLRTREPGTSDLAIWYCGHRLC